MKTKLLLFLFLFAAMANAQVLTFADPTLKAMLVNGGSQNFTAFSNNAPVTIIDINGDHEIQVSEALRIDRLWIEGANAYAVTNIQGIEGFANLTDLGFRGIRATTINLSGMPNLTSLFFKSPVLTSATISGMPGLQTLTFGENDLLASISVSNCNSLQTLIAQQNPGLATLSLNNLLGIEGIYVADNQIGSLDFRGCPNLQHFNASNNQLTSINVSGLASLATFLFENNPNLATLNASGCTSLNLNGASFNNNHALTTADFSGCSSLQYLFIPNSNLNSLNLSGCSALLQVNISNNHLTTLNTTGCTALRDFNCSQNELFSLDMSSCTNISELRANDNVLSALNLTGCNVLTAVNLDSNQITSLNLSGRTSLQSLTISNNQIASLHLSGCTALNFLDTQNTALVTADFSGCAALTQLNINSNLLASVNVQGANALTAILLTGSESQSAPITSLDVSGHTNLQQLICNYANLNAVNIEGCSGLTQLSLFHNPIQLLDFSDSPAITNLNLGYTNFQNIDVTNLLGLQNLTVSGNPRLEMVFAKNGTNENLFFNNQNVALAFVCQDEATIESTQNLLLSLGLSNVEVNSYCSFTPGGNYNTITGTILFDIDNDGCDAGDVKQPNVRIDINDTLEDAATFTNAAGEYTFYTGAGNFNLMPRIENESLFSISPSTAAVSLPNANSNVVTQNFCIAAVGNTKDAEIVIAPIWPAKPGFMAWYQIVIKNKGNQTLSGSLNVTYNQDVLHYAIATILPNVQTPGIIGWNYANLLPFENRSYYVGLNVNSPTQVPPVNIGDVLNFVATVNPIVNDFSPEDNQFVFNQEVVGSFDPNDITCIQGESVSPDAIGEYLHYVINFENTGNAEAENIVVKVVIDQTRYDINSLQLLNTSHPGRTLIHGNVAEFIFPGINLGAAGDPPVNGHGNVLFKIKTVTTLVAGDTASKKANIYFDYNAPIETNRALTTFAALSKPEFETDPTIIVYPNPAKDFISINCNSSIRSVELFDIQGRILQTSLESSNTTKLDISDRSSGVYFVRITTDNGVGVSKIIKD